MMMFGMRTTVMSTRLGVNQSKVLGFGSKCYHLDALMISHWFISFCNVQYIYGVLFCFFYL